MHRGHFGKIAEAEMSVNWGILGLFTQRLPWRGDWSQGRAQARGYWALCSGEALAGQLRLRRAQVPGLCAKCALGRQLKLKWLQGDCSGALHTEGDLVGQLKLNWVQASVSRGAQLREGPGLTTGAKASAGGSVPGCSAQGVPWQGGWN